MADEKTLVNNTENVSTGKPKIGGYAFRAPVGTTLPTDAVTALDKAFVCMGFINEDGVTNSNSPESSDIKDWGGTTVMSVQSARPDTYKFVLIESKSTETLKTVYGDDNVTGDLETGITIKANNDELESKSYVFEMVMSGDTKKRTVLPNAKVTAIGDVVYKSTDAIAYEVTLSCAADSEGNTHYEYIVKA